VNTVQITAGMAMNEDRNVLTLQDVEWVVNSSQMSPRPEKKIPMSAGGLCERVGCLRAQYGQH
jgi:hypothetical protein